MQTEKSPDSRILLLAMDDFIKAKVGKEVFNYFFYKLPLRSSPRFKTAFLFERSGWGKGCILAGRQIGNKKVKML